MCMYPISPLHRFHRSRPLTFGYVGSGDGSQAGVTTATGGSDVTEAAS
jgi:hypothetical protein